MPIIERPDPLDAAPRTSSVRLGGRLKGEVDAVARRSGLSLTETICQMLKWALEHPEKVPAKDPLDLDAAPFSLRIGKPLWAQLKKLAQAKRLSVNEVVVESLKAGLKEEKK
jgi:predicted HicB family RNase H-like nuclease